MGYTTQGIRNIALVGQAGAGKTLLARSAAAPGRRHARQGQPGARHHRLRLRSAGKTPAAFPRRGDLHFDCDGTHINLIDTPGYPDFLGRALTVLEAVETAAVVVSATAGVEPVTQRMMDFARDRELCRLVIINKIDSRDAHPEAVLAQLRERVRRANACR